MTVDYLVVCDEAGADAAGRWFARGIFDRVLSERFPRHIAAMVLLVRVLGAPGEVEQARIGGTA